jgi:oligosaccharyltransferase complex subunit epsilon
VYAKAVGTFPFNAFLAGFFCCVGSFVLTLSLRMRASESGSGSVGPNEFGGYALAMCTLFIASWNYIG